MKHSYLFALLLGLLLTLLCESDARAQWSGPYGPVSLIVLYKCKPEPRPHFYRYLTGTGVSQFEKWKKQGSLDDYLLLFNQYTDKDAWDALAVLNFKPYAQTAHW